MGEAGVALTPRPLSQKMAAARKPIWRGRPESPVSEAYHVQTRNR
jgi:hypothetical protein